MGVPGLTGPAPAAGLSTVRLKLGAAPLRLCIGTPGLDFLVGVTLLPTLYHPYLPIHHPSSSFLSFKKKHNNPVNDKTEPTLPLPPLMLVLPWLVPLSEVLFILVG